MSSNRNTVIVSYRLGGRPGERSLRSLKPIAVPGVPEDFGLVGDLDTFPSGARSGRRARSRSNS